MKPKKEPIYGFDGKPIIKKERLKNYARKELYPGQPRDYLITSGCFTYRKIRGCP